jgi:prophage DNA circulation protein
MAIPAWVERLRAAQFVSPSGRVSNFKIDTLSRVGGKKASIHEILNKDEAIPQDQGNRSTVYQIEAYFTGENGDLEADVFYASLRERYSASSPGTLRHPRWGDLTVMPFEFQQVEQLVTNAGVFRIPVEFREIPNAVFPAPSGVDQSEIVQNITALDEAVGEAGASINIDDSGDRAKFIAKMTNLVAETADVLSSIAAANEDLANTFSLIQTDILASVGDVSPVTTITQLFNLIRTPSKVVDNTLTKVQGYAVLVSQMIDSFVNDFTDPNDVQANLNNARIAEGMILGAVSGTAEAGLFTDYDSRDAAGDALDLVNDAFTDTVQYLSELYGILDNGVSKSFAPDHNTLLLALLVNGQTNAILIDRSFDLRAKQTETLSGPSDPITLTYKYYGTIDELEYFIATNHLTDNEIIEIPAGRQVIAYV